MAEAVISGANDASIEGVEVAFVDANYMDISWDDLGDKIDSMKPDVFIFRAGVFKEDFRVAALEKKANKKCITNY